MARNNLCNLIFQLFVISMWLLLAVPVFADLCGENDINSLVPGLSGFSIDPYITESIPTTDTPSDFGGVSLSKTADMMLNITDISGATYDEATGQIILYGKSPISLPQMKLDDLAVAVRSEYGYGGKSPQDPGVSIGTEPSDIAGQMKVRYDGQTFNTAFGYTMFESDRLLKGYTMGKDNVSGAAVTSNVPGYANLLNRYRSAGGSTPRDNFTYRMWFVPKSVSLVQSPDNSSMQFSNAAMELLTETKFKNNTVADPVSEAFASHFTLHYDDFAAEKPILSELKRLGKITAVVKWIKDNNIPFDLSYFDNYTPAYDNRTPSYTPSTTAFTAWDNGVLHKLTVTGGVLYHLNSSNFSSSQGTTADQAKTAAIAARPGDGSFNWGFSSGGESYQAVAQSMSRSRKDGSVKRTDIDMMFPVPGKNPLILYRYYNSFNDKSTGFGLGWETSPYKLRFPATKMSFTFSGQGVSAYYQIFVKEKGREHLFTLTGLDALGHPIYVREGGKDFLQEESGSFVLYKKNQGTVTFDSDGKFTRITDSNGIYISYAYSGANLASITHQNGRSITLNYTNGKVTSAVGPGGKTVTYTYNANGDLETAKNELSEAVTYQYDNNRRLSNVIDPRNNTVFQASFDDYNRATSQTLGNSATYTKNFNLTARMSTVTDPKNISYTQTFDTDYRLLSMTDTANRKLNVTYAGEFGPATVTDSKNYTTEYQYDAAGNIDYIKDATGKIKLLAYDTNNNPTIARDGRGYDTVNVYDTNNRLAEIRHVAQAEVGTDGKLNGSYGYDTNYVTTYTYDQATGNLLSTKDPMGRLQQFTYDGNGLPITSTLQGGYTVTNTYDSRSRLQKVTNAAGESITYGYDNADRVTSITTSAGVVQYAYDKNGNVSTAYDGKNYPTAYEYNINNKVTKVTDAEGGITGYLYDSTNTRLAGVTLPNGTSKNIEYDSLNRPIRENSQVPNSASKPVVLQSSVFMGSTTAGTSSSQYVSVCNSGQAATSITSITSNNPLFSVTPSSVSLSSQQCANLTVTFTGATGLQTGTLTIAYGDGSTTTVGLSGSVIAALNTQAVPATNGIQLSWNQYSNSALFSQYRVYRSTSPITALTGLSPITTISALSATSYLDKTAVTGLKYYYSVVAVNSASNPLSSVESVGPVAYSNGTDPLAPANPTPQNGATAQFKLDGSLAASLSWSSGASAFDVYLNENQTLVNNSDSSARIVTGTSAKSVATPTLKYGKTYYWKVIAKDGSSVTMGSVWSFATPVIPSPTLIAYTPNVTNKTSPILSWNSIPGIAKYHLQVTNSLVFSPLLADYPNVAATSQTVSQTLPNGKVYWRVAGIDSGGIQGTFSLVSDFTIDTVPPTVQITSPTGLVGKTPRLSYSVSDGTVKVMVDGIQVSTLSGYNLDPLKDGAHTLRVESLDAAGNLGSDEKAFTVKAAITNTECITKFNGSGEYPSIIAVDTNFFGAAMALVDAFQMTDVGFETDITICHNSTPHLLTEINSGTDLPSSVFTTDPGFPRYSLFMADNATAPVSLQASTSTIAYTYAYGIPAFFTYEGTSVDSLIMGLGSGSGATISNACTDAGLSSYKVNTSRAGLVALSGAEDSYGVKSHTILNAITSDEGDPTLLPATIPPWVYPTLFSNIDLTLAAVGSNNIKSAFVSKAQICSPISAGTATYVEFTGSGCTLNQMAILLKSSDPVASALDSYIKEQITNGTWNTFLKVHCYGTL